MINYKDIPDWWPVCHKSDCKLAEACLRQQVCRQMPKNITRWLSILPHVPKDEACKFYQKYEKVMMAQGLNAIYGNVKIRSQRTSVRLKLTSLFGSKGSYYRYKNGERLMNPHLQQMVRDIVHQFAPAVEVRFDNTFEAYDFTRW